MINAKETLEALRDVLNAELQAENAADVSIVPDNAIGRLTRMEAIQSHEMGQAGKRRIKKRLAQIERALQRIEKGEYGTCVKCGEEIPEGRLEIMPENPFCVTCAARMR